MERSTELIRTLEQINMSLREGRSLDISPRTLEAIAGFKVQLESLLQGRKWRDVVEHVWAFGPRRSDSSCSNGLCSIAHVFKTSYLRCLLTVRPDEEPGAIVL